MTQYYGSIEGKASGIEAHIRGWHTGVRVVVQWNDDAQCDEVFVVKTRGSGERESDETIARWLDDGSEVQICL